MTGLDTTLLIATQETQRKALKVLYDNLNTFIDSKQAAWTAEDAAYFTSIGQSAPGFTVEHVQAANFYPGVTPSLIEASVDKYPNVVSFCWQGIPRNSTDDLGEHYNMTLMIEVMVRGHIGAQEVNTRIQRTIDSCHEILMKNSGVLSYTRLPAPIKQLGDVFARREVRGTGDVWFWQGGYLRYQLDKYTNFA